jgi:hypothetical protein
MSLYATPTWKKFEKKWSTGFEMLSREEKEVIALYVLVSEVSNGGLDQYFYNSSGDTAPFALSALERLGMSQTRSLLASALKYFGPTYPVDGELRSRQLEQIEGRDGENVFLEISNAIDDMREDYLLAAVESLSETYAKGSG